MRQRKYKYSFAQWYFVNRWTEKRYSRPCDWVIIGISTRWASPEYFCYRISFFGLEVSFWFKRELTPTTA